MMDDSADIESLQVSILLTCSNKSDRLATLV
jgi:hypothetical protein